MCTLHASRRGHLETRGRETSRSVSRQNLTPKLQKLEPWNSRTLEARKSRKSGWNRLPIIDARSFYRGPGASKITPGGILGHSNSLSVPLWTASGAAIAHLGSYWDTLRDYLGALRPHLAAPGNHFGALRDRFGGPESPFSGPRNASRTNFFDLAAILPKIWKSLKNLCFSMVFDDFRGRENIKIDEKSQKIELGTSRNSKKSTEIARTSLIGWTRGSGTSTTVF